MPDHTDRLVEMEKALDPNVTKFAPKRPIGDPTISEIIQVIRDQAQALLKACDDADKTIAASEADARKAADTLIAMAARIK